MSDGAGPKKKMKLKGTSGRGTPSASASRAGSPVPPQGSKFAHATGQSQLEQYTDSGQAPPPGSPTGAPMEASEILDKIPPEGITIGELIKFFAGRVGDRPGQMPKTDWIRLVRSLCEYGTDKKLRKK